jgi:hypothetical protein
MSTPTPSGSADNTNTGKRKEVKGVKEVNDSMCDMCELGRNHIGGSQLNVGEGGESDLDGFLSDEEVEECDEEYDEEELEDGKRDGVTEVCNVCGNVGLCLTIHVVDRKSARM